MNTRDVGDRDELDAQPTCFIVTPFAWPHNLISPTVFETAITEAGLSQD